MKSNGSSRWSLDLGFVRKGAARISHPLDLHPADLAWSILSVPTGALPISVVECRLSGLGHTVYGYGDSVRYRTSLTQAFAEAWERLYFVLYKGLPLPDGSVAESTNGFAAGATPLEAAEAARAELIERAVLLAAWHSRKGWNRIRAAGIMPRVLSSLLGSRGWDISLFRISEARLGSVFCGFGLRSGGGLLFDSCYPKPGMTVAAVQTKILRSMLRSAVVRELVPPPPKPLPARGGPESHRDFYADPANAAAFEFLAGLTESDEFVELGGYGAIKTSALPEVAGFPHVAVATNQRWPRLLWGRESILEGGNEWPHPLA